MTLLGLILTIAFVGALVYIITLIPMDLVVKRILYVVVAIFLVLLVLQGLGLDTTPIPRLRLW